MLLTLALPPVPRPALADPVAVNNPVVNSVYQIPLQSFAYHPNPQSTYYKYGINLSLGGASSPRLFEFDTGGDGFYTTYGTNVAWWGGSVGPSGTLFSKSFDSGYTYAGVGLTTSVSFFGLGSNPGNPIFTTPSSYVVGAANQIFLNQSGLTSEVWNGSDSGSAPVEQNFYGDFGLTLKRGNDGIQNLLAQLTYGGDAHAGYSVALGPYGSSGGAYLQLGLLASDLANPATSWFAMQGTDNSRPFANSSLASFSAELIKGVLQLTLNGNNISLADLGLNLDSGTPGVTLHYNDSDRSQLVPYSVLDHNGDPVRLLEQVMLNLQAQAQGSALEQDLLAFVTGDNYGLNAVNTNRRSDGGTTYLNTGASLFQNYIVTYDLANQRVGLTPYPVPGPTPLAAGLISGAFGLRLRALRARIRAARSAGSPQAGSSRATAAR